MTRLRHRLGSEKGLALAYLAVSLGVLTVFVGLAVDSGRAYVVRAQLTKAVDGAALAGARNLNTSNPQAEAIKIFNANFPAGYMGTTSVSGPNFSLTTNEADGVNIINVSATAVLPTPFMRVASFNEVTVAAVGQATRRMVDLSFVLDVSSSIGWRWPYVRDASREFVDSFDALHDRVSLTIFGNGAKVLDAMPSSRGFDKPSVMSDIPDALPGGSTNMVEGLYRGWDELRSVPGGQQSSLRVIVLFTDGASNGVPGLYDGGTAKSLRSWDFPENSPDPDNQTHNAPRIDGLYHTQTGNQSPTYALTPPNWNSTQTHPSVPFLPTQSYHAFHRSAGIPTQFPLQSSSIMVNGAPQTTKRGLRNFNSGVGKYPAEVFNINNAARNLVEIISNEARNDTGDYRIRIYTIGMGELVRYLLGTMPEKPESILMRMANDRDSMDFNSAQLEGKYFFAETESDVAAAFEALQNQIIRLTK